MIHRRVMTALLGAGLLVGCGFAMSGCGGEEGQPSRGSISAPRDKGGVVGTSGEKVKAKPAAGGKVGGKAGDL